MNAAASDFRLQAGSPARTLGVDILDLDGDGSTTDIIPAGAYVTGNEVIGLIPSNAPTLSLTASPTAINPGGSSTLSWSSTNVTSCTASGAWTGAKATSGTQSVSPTSTSTYTLTCTGANGSVNQNATVTVNPATPVACNTVTPATWNSIPGGNAGYGAPYDFFNGNTSLLDATCTSADPHTAPITVGQVGSTTHAVYMKSYYYDPGILNWAELQTTCTGVQNGDWCNRPVTATITDSDISTASAGAPAYFVGMVCSVQGGSWRCGCRDTSCANFYWMIQGAGQ